MTAPKIKKSDFSYQCVNSFLEEKKIKASEDQIKVITITAFKFYRHGEGAPVRASLKIKDLNSEHQEKFVQAIQQVLVHAHSPWVPKVAFHSENQILFFNLIRGIRPPLSSLFQNPTLIKAIIWKKNSEVLDDAKALLQNIFDDLFANIQADQLTPGETFHYEVMIGDLLALFPFLRPQEGSELRVPLRLDGEWQLAAFNVQEIALTPNWLGSPYTAYGLNPKSNDNAVPPLLLYKGTTYPTDKGFLLSLLTDINPITSVGSYIFKLGRKKIENWLETQTQYGNKKAIIYGKSLGGAQSWRTGINFPSYISKVMAYGAPGFSIFALKKLENNTENLPEINFFFQTNDIIPYLDKVSNHKNIHYYEVSSHINKTGLLAHAFMYSTHESSTLLRVLKIKQNHPWKRLALTFAHALVSLVAFPIFLMIYLIYNTLHQAKKYIFKQISFF